MANDTGAGLPNEMQDFHPQFDATAPLLIGSEKLQCALAERCGGCPAFGLTPLEQRASKASALLAGLRARGIVTVSGMEWLTGKTTAYRNRIRLAVRDGVPTYFNEDKDSACKVLEPRLLSAVAAFKRWAPDYRQALRSYCVAEVRSPDADGKAAVYLRHTHRNGPAVPPPDWAHLPDEVGDMLVAVEGGPVRLQRYPITEVVHAQIPIGAFMQVNASANRQMVERVVDWAVRVNASRVLDLFAGSGNFTLPMAHAGAEVLAVEYDSAACSGLRAAASTQGLSNVVVQACDAMECALALAASGETYDIIVADPPRGGLRGNVEALCSMARLGVVLISCDADRFVDDAHALSERGFSLRECVAVDMFPHTRHMEILGRFSSATFA